MTASEKYKDLMSQISPLSSITAEDYVRLGFDLDHTDVLYSGPGEYARCVTIMAPNNLSKEEIQRRKDETMRIVNMMHQHNLARKAYPFQQK